MAGASRLIVLYGVAGEVTAERSAERNADMRAVLADREPAVRRALRAVLTQDLGMDVVGEAETAPELRHLVAECQPGLLVADWELVDTPSTTTPAVLRQLCPGLYIVVLSVHPVVRQDALTAGANAFVTKVDAPDQVVGALRAAG